MLGSKWLLEIPNSECKQNLWCITTAGENRLAFSSLAVKLKALLLGLICAAAGSSEAVFQLFSFSTSFPFFISFLSLFLSLSAVHDTPDPLELNEKTAWLCTPRPKSSINANPVSASDVPIWVTARRQSKVKYLYTPHSDILTLKYKHEQGVQTLRFTLHTSHYRYREACSWHSVKWDEGLWHSSMHTKMFKYSPFWPFYSILYILLLFPTWFNRI